MDRYCHSPALPIHRRAGFDAGKNQSRRINSPHATLSRYAQDNGMAGQCRPSARGNYALALYAAGVYQAWLSACPGSWDVLRLEIRTIRALHMDHEFGCLLAAHVDL